MILIFDRFCVIFVCVWLMFGWCVIVMLIVLCSVR